MTKVEAEDKIFGLLNEIRSVYQEVNPAGKNLVLSIGTTGDMDYIEFHNHWWDSEEQVKFDLNTFRVVEVRA